MRFYGFAVHEIVNDEFPLLDMELDPKLAWAIRNLHEFPVDINKDPYEKLVRVPGIGVGTAKKICATRRFQPLGLDSLKKMGMALNRAKHFIVCRDHRDFRDYLPAQLRSRIIQMQNSKYLPDFSPQLQLF